MSTTFLRKLSSRSPRPGVTPTNPHHHQQQLTWSSTHSIDHKHVMPFTRLILRSSRTLLTFSHPFSTFIPRLNINERGDDTTVEWRKKQAEKPLNPHLTNTTSIIANEMPSVDKQAPPPEMLSSADPNFVPKDAVPENTGRITGGTQSSSGTSGLNRELRVGELEGAKFKVEPLRRTGEDVSTTRARLLCPLLSAAKTPFSRHYLNWPFI
jgi:hypothetical protein